MFNLFSYLYLLVMEPHFSVIHGSGSRRRSLHAHFLACVRPARRTVRSRNLGVVSIVMALTLMWATPATFGQEAPIKKSGLLQALRLNGLTTRELIERVARRGVNFRLTTEDERELRAAGARPELIGAIRNNYRPPIATVPDAATTPSGNRPTLKRREPTYDDLVDAAEQAIDRRDYLGAKTLCFQAVANDGSRSAAYQYLAIAEIRGSQDYTMAEKHMRLAIERGGNAVFQVDHDHIAGQGLSNARFMFNSTSYYCSGSLFVSSHGLAFRTNGATLHEFSVEGSEVKESDINSYFGKHAAAFNVKAMGTLRGNYNFAPVSRDSREAGLVVRLIQEFIVNGSHASDRTQVIAKGKDAPNVEATIALLVSRKWIAGRGFLVTRNNERLPLTLDYGVLVFQRDGKRLRGEYTNSKGLVAQLTTVSVLRGRVVYSFTDPTSHIAHVSTVAVGDGELSGESTLYDFYQRGISITVAGRQYPVHGAVIRWTATPQK